MSADRSVLATDEVQQTEGDRQDARSIVMVDPLQVQVFDRRHPERVHRSHPAV
jgi:hypothetical protein